MGSVWFPQAQTEARRDSNPYSVANRLDKGSVCPSFCRLRHIGCPKLLNSSCSSSFSLSSPFLFGDFWIDFLLVVDLGDDSKPHLHHHHRPSPSSSSSPTITIIDHHRSQRRWRPDVVSPSIHCPKPLPLLFSRADDLVSGGRCLVTGDYTTTTELSFIKF
ncbi:hypothetical protein LWI28_023207 [Acer negundo]|uniref:Uncharacterized protein n=1 Tax=Acer negundo TaxID=4023 RepID=A0AAD5IR65_ACENE|nr:hypothetical protein LWI28_023207 [Acer negundo]